MKTDKADAFALAEMLRTGWYSAVHVKSEASHKLKALLGARDQLVRAKRALGNQVRGLLRPFGIKLAVAAGHEEVCRSRLCGGGARRDAFCERDGADGGAGGDREPDSRGSMISSRN